jgi:hypothetical protein
MQLKRFNLIFTLALLVLLGSCAKENPSFNADLSWLSEDNYHSAIINKVEPTSSLVAGVPASFSVTYSKPNPCYFIVQVKTHINQFNVNLGVFLDYPNPPPICSDVLVEETTQFQILFPHKGTYTINFKGVNGVQSIAVNVN